MQKTKNFDSVTIGYIAHDYDVHKNFLGHSIGNLYTSIEVIAQSDKNKPAKNYNEILSKSSNDIVILTHQDVSFSSDLVERIDNTISEVGEFAALGMVGVDNNGSYHWSSESRVHELCTADCCFLVVNKSHGITFDEETFDDYHLYVEDYCAQAKSVTGHKVYTMLVNSQEAPPQVRLENNDSYLNHHSVTLNKRGPAWGRYWEYREKLEAKWPGIQTT